jgi:hypothetical protein
MFMGNISHEPIRKIGLGTTSLTGLISSTKTNRNHAFESSLERDFIKIIDFDRNVNHYCEQPVTIEYMNDSNYRQYTPDFLVHYRETTNMKPLLCEIKYRKDIKENWNVLKPKFKAAIEYSKKNNWNFKIITEIEIRTQYLKNIRFLENYKKEKIDKNGFLTGIDENDFNILTYNMDKIKITTPEELVLMSSTNKYKQAEFLYVIWYLVANNWVKCDLNFPLSIKSEIWVD